MLRQENEQLRAQLSALATELATLRERIGRTSRNSSKPPSSNGKGFKPPERRRGSGRKRGGQQGHPESWPELLPFECVEQVVEHRPDACRRCGTLLVGDDPEPLRHQVIEIPPIIPVVKEYRLHRLACPCCSTSTCAPLPTDVEPTRYGPRLSALVGLLGSAFPYSFGEASRLCATSQMFNLNADATGSRWECGLPEPACRGRLQTTPCCSVQKSGWRA